MDERAGSLGEQAMAGRRLKDYIWTAMHEAGIRNWSALSRATGLNRGTLNDWWSGQVRPNRGSLILVGNVVGRTPDQLEAILHGRPIPGQWTDDQLEAAVERALRRVLAERHTE